MKKFELINLTCCRGPMCLFKNLSVRVDRGEILRITGANGCGKSSALKTITGRLPPVQGQVLYNEAPLKAAHFLYLDHRLLLKPVLTLDENIHFWSQLYRASDRDKEEAYQVLGLSALKDMPVKSLSQGQAKRAQLSLLFLKKSPIWLLDEPLNSLDRTYIIRLGEIFHEHIRSGGIIIYASHASIPGVPEKVIDLTNFGVRQEEQYEMAQPLTA